MFWANNQCGVLALYNVFHIVCIYIVYAHGQNRIGYDPRYHNFEEKKQQNSLDDPYDLWDNRCLRSSESAPNMFRLGFVFLALVLLGCFVTFAQRLEVPTTPEQKPQAIVTPLTTQTPLAKRYREGTALKSKHVFFRQTGDRTVLYTVGDNQRYTCLENLALERVLTASLEKPERQFWKIDGEFTEFRGENFIIIRRASIAQDPATIVPASPLAP